MWLSTKDLTFPQVIWRWRIAYVILVLAFAGSLAWNSSWQADQRSNDRRKDREITTIRRHDNCISRQRLYDGQEEIVDFLADEFQVTQKQRVDGFARLHKKLGPRPVCP